MWNHYLLSALRAIRRAPFTTCTNILTLGLGLACFVAAYGIASYWNAGGSSSPGLERVAYVCMYCQTGQPGEVQSPHRLAGELRSQIPGLEVVGRLGFPAEYAVSSGEQKAFLKGMPADPQLLELFEHRFTEGNAEQALRAPGDVIITSEAARRLFGDGPALGRSLRVDGAWDATISGVIDPSTRPVFLNEQDLLVNLNGDRQRMIVRDRLPPELVDTWNSGSVQTFVRLPPSMTLPQFQSQLESFGRRVMPRLPDGSPELPLTAHPYSHLMGSMVTARFTMGEDLGVTASGALLGLGTLILLVAGLNFSNLASAQAATRVKEAGLRKVLGARTHQVLMQHIVEAGVITLSALALAVCLVALAAPVFRNALGADPLLFLSGGGRGVLFLAGVALLTTVAVGIWPAWTLARTRPVDALGTEHARAGVRGWISRMLVGLQFMSASFLLILVAVLELQHSHMREAAFDAAADPVVVLNELNQTGVSLATLATELQSVPQVRAVTGIPSAPWSGRTHARMIGKSGEPGTSGIRVSVKAVGPGYFDTFELGALAGRVFDPASDRAGFDLFAPESTGPVSVVIDLTLARALGFADAPTAIGQLIYETPQNDSATPGRAVGRIQGVVEREFSQLNAVVSGTLFAFDPAFERAQIPAVRVDQNDVVGALAGIRRVWDAQAPHIPLRAQFSDDLFESRYAPLHTVAAVFLALSAAAFLISTAGILAVAVHVVARRRHEIGVRKTLGASTGRVLRMLIVDLSKPVVIGNLLAWPLAWMVSQLYLRLFIERITLGIGVFAGSLLFTLLVAWAAIGGQAWRAARVKPALVLRAE